MCICINLCLYTKKTHMKGPSWHGFKKGNPKILSTWLFMAQIDAVLFTSFQLPITYQKTSIWIPDIRLVNGSTPPYENQPTMGVWLGKGDDPPSELVWKKDTTKLDAWNMLKPSFFLFKLQQLGVSLVFEQTQEGDPEVFPQNLRPTRSRPSTPQPSPVALNRLRKSLKKRGVKTIFREVTH